MAASFAYSDVAATAKPSFSEAQANEPAVAQMNSKKNTDLVVRLVVILFFMSGASILFAVALASPPKPSMSISIARIIAGFFGTGMASFSLGAAILVALDFVGVNFRPSHETYDAVLLDVESGTQDPVMPEIKEQAKDKEQEVKQGLPRISQFARAAAAPATDDTVE